VIKNPVIKNDRSVTKSELIRRLDEAEAMVESLRKNEIDAIIGEKKVSFVRWREVEEQLIIARKIAEDRASELEDFSYSISHDLRGPLTVIKLCVELLIDDYSDKIDSTGQDYVRRINSSTNKMIDHINHILNLSKVISHELQKKDTDLNAIVLRTVSELRQSDPDRKVKVHIHKDLTVYGDEKLLEIAMNNLIGNAWKFSSKNNQAEIEVGKIDQNGNPLYFVRDNGVGFNMNQSKVLFNSFKRLHPDHMFPGSGVGLSIIKRVINIHGGEIWAEGEPDKGATFYFSLPSRI
jgi:light-regulated signal transduction histidine kinase (bacteriophytochrome)